MIRLALDREADVVVVQDPPLPVSFGAGSSELQVRDPTALGELELDVVVVSPGVSRYRPELEHLRSVGVEITSATALWLEDFSSRQVIGVTGSKGKTMTAVLTAMSLESTGMSVGLGGNIGTPVTDFYEGPRKMRMSSRYRASKLPR